MKTRETILAVLEIQYKEQFAGKGYKDEFKVDAFLTECNFGGLCIICSNSGDSVIIWRDLGDDVISTQLTECMVEYHDSDGDGIGDGEFPDYIAQFLYEGTWYKLNEFMRS